MIYCKYREGVTTVTTFFRVSKKEDGIGNVCNYIYYNYYYFLLTTYIIVFII